MIQQVGHVDEQSADCDLGIGYGYGQVGLATAIGAGEDQPAVGVLGKLAGCLQRLGQTLLLVGREIAPTFRVKSLKRFVLQAIKVAAASELPSVVGRQFGLATLARK